MNPKLRQQHLNFIRDSLLIESLAASEISSLRKQAGLFDSLGLSGVADSIKDFFKSHISADAPGGYVGSFFSLMAPAVFFRVNPFFGILYLIGTQFGFDVQSVFSKIMSAIKPKLEEGKSITPDEINNIGKSIVAAEAGISAEAQQDPFLLLRKNADFMKYISEYDKPRAPGQTLPKTPILFPGKDSSLIQRIFGQLFSPQGKGKGKWLLGGFIIWMVKSALAGAGLLAGTEMIAKSLGHKPEQKLEDHKPIENLPEHPTELDKVLKSGKDVWIVPLINNSIVDTLISWIKELYDVTEIGVLDFIKKLPEFNTIKNELSKATILANKYLVMPEQFSSRKQIVDLIVPEEKL